MLNKVLKLPIYLDCNIESDYSVDALTGMYIYASHPAQLNDPFDCCDMLFKFNDEENCRALLDELYDKFREIYTEDDGFYSVCSKLFSIIIYKKWGVISMTSSCENNVMWSHYSNNEGFCIEFDYNNFPFKTSGPFKINYIREFEEMLSSSHDVRELLLYQTNVKDYAWSYEDEYRLLVWSPPGFDMASYGEGSEKYNSVDDHDRKFRYPISAIKSITLGDRFFDNESSILISDFEFEFRASSQKKKVLDFLVSLTSSFHNKINGITIYLSMIYGLKRERKIIAIYKISDCKYRVVLHDRS